MTPRRALRSARGCIRNLQRQVCAFSALQIFPSLDVASGYDSNVLGNAGGGARRGSWSVTTAPAVNATTDWSRNQLGVSVSLQSTQYLSMPAQNQINGTAAAGGRLDIGQDQLTIAAAHARSTRTSPASTPSPAQARSPFRSTTFQRRLYPGNGRWNLTPALEASSWTLRRRHDQWRNRRPVVPEPHRHPGRPDASL